MAHPFDNPYAEKQPTAPTVWRSRLWAARSNAYAAWFDAYLRLEEQWIAEQLNSPNIVLQALQPQTREELLQLYREGRVSKKLCKKHLRRLEREQRATPVR